MCGSVGSVIFFIYAFYVLKVFNFDWQRIWLITGVQFSLPKVTCCLAWDELLSLSLPNCATCKIAHLALSCDEAKCFLTGKKRWSTKSVCGAAAWCRGCFGQVSAGVRRTMGSRLTRWSSNGLFGQSTSGSQPLCLVLGQGKQVRTQLVEIKVA